MESTVSAPAAAGVNGPRSEAASVNNKPAAEVAGTSDNQPSNAVAEKTQATVDAFLKTLDSLPADPNLTRVREKFVEMFNPERTDKEYLESTTFRNILRLAEHRCQQQISKANVHIREVIDNMLLNQPKTEEQRRKIQENKRQKIRAMRSSETLYERLYLTLESTLQKIRSAELREESNDEDSRMESNYVYLDRLQKRAVDLYKKIQSIEGNKATTLSEMERPVVVRSTQYPEINRATAKMANRCLKRGMTPDFCDVITVVKRISEQEDLGMTEDKKKSVAVTVFKEIIDQIKNRRIKDTMRNFESLEIELTDMEAADPADADEVLRQQLKDNSKEGQARIDSVINKFADKQTKGGADCDSDCASDISDDEPEGEDASQPDNGCDNSDEENGAQNYDNEKEEDESSRESIVDEKYLDTGSSEEEAKTDEVNCDEIIRRYGQDRERPRAEVRDDAASSSQNGTAKRLRRTEEDESDCSDAKVVVIEVTDSDDELTVTVSNPPRKRVIPKRLMTLGSTPPREDPPPQNDHDNVVEFDGDSSQDVIEISD